MKQAKMTNSSTKIHRIILMCISLTLASLIYNIFLLPLNLVTGGINGIAIIIKNIYNIESYTVILFLSIICVIISLIFLGLERTIGTLVASLVYPILIKITSPIANIVSVKTCDTLLIIIWAGVCSGIANGLMYKSKYSNGGFPILSQILFEKYGIPIVRSNIFINVSIVIIGSFFFGIDKALYAIIFLYINGIVINKLLLGPIKNKVFYIMTYKKKEVMKYILNDLKHNATILSTKGGFLQKKNHIIITLIPVNEYHKMVEYIKKIDKKALITMTDICQVECVK